MEVIGAGMGRTGTLSLKAALERLGFAPCYHMLEVIDHPDDIPVWAAAAHGEAVDFQGLFDGYRATMDWPACTFWRELIETFPDAKVVLSLRDPQRWYESMMTTIYGISNRTRSAPPGAVPEHLRQLGQMTGHLLWERTFGGRFEDRDHAIAVFERHNEDIRRGVPAGRLLEYAVGQGWEPLCEFLGVPVPDEPFPHLNDAASFQARVDEQTGGGPPPRQ